MTPVEFHSLLRRWREAQKILDLRSGMVASTIANVNRRKGSTPFKPQDFMLFREPEKVLSVEDSKHYLEGLAAMFGGTVTRQVN